ncbi:MAG: ABC transporter permease [Candidatus Zixiibacteriota bacterium]
MNSAKDISLLSLLLCYALLLIPIIILILIKSNLLKKLAISIFRMTFQLFIVGLFLQYIFDLESPYVTIGWLLIMILFSSFSVIGNSPLKLSHFFIPIALAILIANAILLPFFNGLVIKLDNLLAPRYAIAIGGMLLGNSMRGNIVFLNSFFKDTRRNENRYRYMLSLGASKFDALLPFFRNGFREAVSPMLATTATMGIVSLPGMMTGQILGGSPPMVAIKYQIAIMLAIFTSMTLSSSLVIIFSVITSFDKYDVLKDNIFKKKKKSK